MEINLLKEINIGDKNISHFTLFHASATIQRASLL
ncbi:hypothetical protein SAMN06265348_102442 [Pedobacter westerhofensis]|uniref:Uncharacterized protein n=1 Tax=Pedobacter westerhofensis TaxID=425512 RepID=A0A521BPN7_9SPHI|nr:hypothetical protein SAMN06265348_102442 [Pedobacter westerhofensis]